MTLIFDNREKQRETSERATLYFRKMIKVSKLTLLLVYESKRIQSLQPISKRSLSPSLPTYSKKTNDLFAVTVLDSPVDVCLIIIAKDFENVYCSVRVSLCTVMFFYAKRTTYSRSHLKLIYKLQLSYGKECFNERDLNHS